LLSALRKIRESKNNQQSQTLFEDTKEAWLEKDETGPENENVHFGRFVWNRKKSNDNITDTDDGRGFSFYYARYVFNDKYVYEAFNETNPENEKTVGIIPKGNEKVMVVINAAIEDSLIRIISAWEVDDTSIWAKRYWKHRKFKESQTQETIENQSRLVESFFKNRR
jgi:uncharacterized DUF497 family protein